MVAVGFVHGLFLGLGRVGCGASMACFAFRAFGAVGGTLLWLSEVEELWISQSFGFGLLDEMDGCRCLYGLVFGDMKVGVRCKIGGSRMWAKDLVFDRAQVGVWCWRTYVGSE